MAIKWANIFNLRRTIGSQIDSPRSYRFLGGGRTVVSPDTAMKVAAFHRGVTYIATQIAKLPWELKDKNQTVITDGTIPFMLGLAPNPEMNAFNFRVWLIANALIKGNSYCEIERTVDGRPIALWPLRTEDVTLARDEDHNLIYRVSGDNTNYGQVILDPKNVFHIKNFHTKDGLLGQGLVAYAQETLGISSAADKMAGALFNNSGIPSGVITVPGKLSDDAYKRLDESWSENHSGKNSGGTAILEEGSTFNAINLSPDVLQFLDSRKFGVLEIARFLGVPPAKLFDVERNTYSNVEQANLEVVTDTLHAWAANLETEADVKLLGLQYGGRFTEIDLYSITRADMTTRANYFAKMMASAVFSPAEIRNFEGKPAYPGSDRYYIATNNFTPVDKMDEVIDSQITRNTTPPPAPAAPDKNENEDEDAPDQKHLAAAVIKFLEK